VIAWENGRSRTLSRQDVVAAVIVALIALAVVS